MEEVIKAPKGMVLRAYMVSLGLETRNFRSRVLIDQCGMVFRNSHDNGGWMCRQNFYYEVCSSDGHRLENKPSYKFVVLPEPIKMWDNYALWNFWWESRAWRDTAWAWVNYNKRN